MFFFLQSFGHFCACAVALPIFPSLPLWVVSVLLAFDAIALVQRCQRGWVGRETPRDIWDILAFILLLCLFDAVEYIGEHWLRTGQYLAPHRPKQIIRKRHFLSDLRLAIFLRLSSLRRLEPADSRAARRQERNAPFLPSFFLPFLPNWVSCKEWAASFFLGLLHWFQRLVLRGQGDQRRAGVGHHRPRERPTVAEEVRNHERNSHALYGQATHPCENETVTSATRHFYLLRQLFFLFSVPPLCPRWPLPARATAAPRRTPSPPPRPPRLWPPRPRGFRRNWQKSHSIHRQTAGESKTLDYPEFNI